MRCVIASTISSGLDGWTSRPHWLGSATSLQSDEFDATIGTPSSIQSNNSFDKQLVLLGGDRQVTIPTGATELSLSLSS